MRWRESFKSRWLGLFDKTQEPAVLVYGAQCGDFAQVEGLVSALLDAQLRTNVALCSPDCRSWRGHQVVHLPKAGALFYGIFLSKLKIRAIVSVTSLPNGLTRAARKRATPVAGPDTPVAQVLRLVGRERRWNERRNNPIGRFLAERLFDRLARGNGRAGGIERIGDISGLAQGLGHPKSILCLGNGPSSEGEAVRKVRFDALFRANHGWLDRGFLVEPDMVFTGMQTSMKRLPTPILCVLGETAEKVLLMVRAKNFFAGRLRYFVAGDNKAGLDLAIRDGFRPTSGAVMLAVAVALKPEKLIVAGIDMFQHPDGSYPGDNKTPNAYTATHSRDAEEAFMFRQLERFDGELVILSDIFRQAWERHNRALRNG